MIRFVTTIALLLTCFTSMWGVSVHSVPYDSVHYVIFKDTVYDQGLPPVEVEYLTYSNFHQTTVGYQFILRDTELDILDVELYIGNPQKKYKTNMPFSLHMGNRHERNRIDKVSIWNKFPFDTITADSDSLMIITNHGNITLYMSEEMRLQQSLDKERSIFVHQKEELQSKNYTLRLWLCIIITLFILLFIGLIVAHYIRIKRRDDNVANLMAILEENETKTKNLNEAVATLFKHNFNTLNRLCYEYYEKGDTQALRKSIFNQIEKEILKFRETDEISLLEQDLNKYLNNIIIRLDEQMPGLNETERTLLIYLFSGFSARTICTICVIEIITFYMRRYRLKNKIMASEAADKELFESLM